MHRHRREKLIELAPAIPPSRSFPAVRVLRTAEELEAAQDRARAFERRDAERYQRLHSYSEFASALALERSPEFTPRSDLHPAGSGLSVHNRPRGLRPETTELDAGADGSGQQVELMRRAFGTYETQFHLSGYGSGIGTQAGNPQ
jgi:hypothetical protein